MRRAARATPGGKLNPRIGQPPGFAPAKRELPTNCYRLDPSGRIDLVVTEDQVPDPERPLLLARTTRSSMSPRPARGRATPARAARATCSCSTSAPTTSSSNGKRFSDFMIDGVKCGPDGVRCDVNGNVWCSSNAGRAVGYSGVTVWSPDGKLLGRIRLPEVCGNITFGGPKRNRLFMAASQSLYAVYTATQGAGPAQLDRAPSASARPPPAPSPATSIVAAQLSELNARRCR